MLNERSIFYKRVNSTQDVAYKLALQGEPEGTVVISDYQTAGRGRLGRKWFASPGKSILCSLILRPNIPAEQVFLLTRSAAYAIKTAIEKKTNLSVYFKHPNDLLISGKKVAGVLAETRVNPVRDETPQGSDGCLQQPISNGVKGEKLEFVILGIGINVNPVRSNPCPTDGRQAPAATVSPMARTSNGVNTRKEQLIEEATSLKQETNKSFSRPALLKQILRKFWKEYSERR